MGGCSRHRVGARTGPVWFVRVEGTRCKQALDRLVNLHRSAARISHKRTDFVPISREEQSRAPLAMLSAPVPLSVVPGYGVREQAVHGSWGTNGWVPCSPLGWSARREGGGGRGGLKATQSHPLGSGKALNGGAHPEHPNRNLSPSPSCLSSTGAWCNWCSCAHSSSSPFGSGEGDLTHTWRRPWLKSRPSPPPLQVIQDPYGRVPVACFWKCCI